MSIDVLLPEPIDGNDPLDSDLVFRAKYSCDNERDDKLLRVTRSRTWLLSPTTANAARRR